MRNKIKLYVQIPCLNEVENIAGVIQAIPRKIPGVADVKVLVVDDGSSDGTAKIALKAGADHIVTNKKTSGLAASFQLGLSSCLELGADIIVNTDGDHQYPSQMIPKLIAPILSGQADIVVGNRNPSENKEFSILKRKLQKIGSNVVRKLSGLDVPDAVSGFRAYSRNAAVNTRVFTSFSYTTETLISAGRHGMSVVSIPVTTNYVARPSRLASSMLQFLGRQVITILRSYIMYSPLRAFGTFGLILLTIGSIPILRFLIYYMLGEGQGHIQSLVIGSMVFILGFFTMIIAVLSDIIATNRQLLEMSLVKLHQLELKIGNKSND